MFTEKNNAKKGRKSDTIKALYENFQRTWNVNDDHAGNSGRPHAAITDTNVELEQAMQEVSRVSVRKVQLSLDYDACQRTVSCVTAFACFY